MTYDEFMDILVESNVEDWIWDHVAGRYVYKNNLAITMQEDNDWCRKCDDGFAKMNGHLAELKKVYICYMGSIIEEFILISVDEGRARIPLSKTPDNLLSRKQYRIGRILNAHECSVYDVYDEHIRKIGYEYL